MRTTLKGITIADIATEPEWPWAPIGVLSHHERDRLNRVMMKRWCQCFNVPLVRWKIVLDQPMIMSNIPQGRSYDDERKLWEYYAHGSPVFPTENLASQRGLVNGTMGLMHSLNFGHAEPPAEYLHAERSGKCDLITLKEPPTAVIVRVGNGSGQNFR